MNRRSALATVGSMVGLGGCLRLRSSDGQGSPTGTAPADEPSQSPTGTPDTAESATGTEVGPPDPEYPTGLSDSGVDGYLGDSHQNALLQTSYTIDVRHENVTEGRLFNESTVRGDGTTAVVTFREADLHTAKYITGPRRSWTTDLRGTRTYGDHEGSGFPGRLVTKKNGFSPFLEAGDWSSPEQVREDGDSRFRTTTSSVKDPTPLLERRYRAADRIVSLSGTLLVRPDGIVDELTAETEMVVGDTLRLASYSLAVTDAGGTSVGEPDWLSTARQQAPEIASRLEGDGAFLVHANEGGGNVIAETEARLRSSGGPSGRQRLPSPVAPGEELWLWFEDGQLQLAYTRPSDASPDPLPDDAVSHLKTYKASYTVVGVQSL